MSDVPPSQRASWPAWLMPGLIVVAFLLLLGSRGLNEPDEGRYAEIAREMVETGDWLVPHIWYVPHLDKPPMTYWLVGLSIECFGTNEWAVRLPVALAGLSGVWAAYLLALSLGGLASARASTLILASSVLYFLMSRMLTTDIFLTQFIAWSVYYFWRSWECLEVVTSDNEDVRGNAARQSFKWQILAWAMLGGGFLTKGPIAVIIPLIAFGALMIFRRRDATRRNILFLGAMAGVTVFSIVALPWFLMVFNSVPGSFNFMLFDRLAGHALGTTVTNRGGSPFYFFAVIAVGFLPWTPLFGWLWRRAHWRGMNASQKDGWVMLTAWLLSTFIIFSLNRSKLPAYILPLFPALAIMVALRWPDIFNRPAGSLPSKGVWQCTALLPLLLMAALPLVYRLAFGVKGSAWGTVQLIVAAALILIVAVRGRRWPAHRLAQSAVLFSLLNLLLAAAYLPNIETELKNNQSLKPLGTAVRQEYQNGDKVVCWARLPQGLPFYAFPAISATNRPYLGRMPEDRMPFLFPGNRAQLEPWLIKDESSFKQMLAGQGRLLVVAFKGTFAQARQWLPTAPLRLIFTAGDYELFVNHP